MRRIILIAAAGLTLAVTALGQEKVIYPRSAALADAPASPPTPGFNGALLFLALAAAGVGGWLLWRQRRTTAGFAGREARKLAVAESRSLGNRQYLVVADYDGKKFLIGVCPGRIDLLAPLDSPGGVRPS